MKRFLTAWVALVLLSGCVRLIAPGKSGSGALGEGCDTGTACLSGYCSDGVCCAEDCGGSRACNRPRTIGRCVAREAGDRCQPGVADTCGGLHCVTESGTSICCNTSCTDARSSCQIAGSLGQCTARTEGDSCGAQLECPAGTDGQPHCTDHVCCDTACNAPCFSCSVAGHAGTCTPVPDNTDPDMDCLAPDAGGACTACFGGQCLPALVGSNPKDGCEDGLVCGNTTRCSLAIGAACSADAGAGPACAEGTCLLHACTHLVTTPLGSLVVSPNPPVVRPMAASLTRDGSVGLMWKETQPQNGGTVLETIVFARQLGAGWATSLVSFGGGLPSAALAAAGNFHFLVTGPAGEQLECDYFPDACNVLGRWVQPDGRLGSQELIWEVPMTSDADRRVFEPAGGPVCGLLAQAMDDNSILLAVILGTPGLACPGAASTWDVHVMTRSPQGQWSGSLANGKVPEAAPLVGNTFGVVAVRMLAGAPVLVDVTPEKRLRATRFPKGQPVEVVLSDGSCDVGGAAVPALTTASTTALKIAVGGGCETPTEDAILAFLEWNGTLMAWNVVRYPATSPRNARVLVPLGDDVENSRFLGDMGYSVQAFGGYANQEFSSEWVPFHGPVQTNFSTFPRAASLGAHSHVLFSCELDPLSDPLVARFPFAVRVEF